MVADPTAGRSHRVLVIIVTASDNQLPGADIPGCAGSCLGRIIIEMEIPEEASTALDQLLRGLRCLLVGLL